MTSVGLLRSGRGISAAGGLLVAIVLLCAVTSNPDAAWADTRNGVIAFSSPLDKRNGCDEIIGCAARIVYVNPDGSGRHKMPCAARNVKGGGCYDAAPAFSHDGRFLATGTDGLTGDRLSSRDEVIIRSARGGSVVRRIRVNGAVKDLAWSGDGTRLAFNDFRRIRIVRRDGTGLHTFRRTGGDDVDWSRTGRLAWSSDTRSGIWLTDRSRRRVRRFRNAAPRPNWSRSGRRLLVADEPGWSVVSARRPARRRFAQLSRCYNLEYGAALSPDGRSVACGTLNGDLIVTRLATPRRARVIARGVRPMHIAWRTKPR